MTSVLTDELFEQGPEPILLIDKASPAVPAPREIVGVFGYLQEEIIGETVVSLIVAEEIPKEAECFSDLIAQGQTVE